MAACGALGAKALRDGGVAWRAAARRWWARRAAGIARRPVDSRGRAAGGARRGFGGGGASRVLEIGLGAGRFLGFLGEGLS